jgi:hypothetical protein
MDDFLLSYINDNFLKFVCGSQSSSSDTKGLIYTTWSCPCEITSINNMPQIQFKLYDEDLFYIFDAKEYFYYPYYHYPETLPR